jgi:hypothetical protein
MLQSQKAKTAFFKETLGYSHVPGHIYSNEGVYQREELVA